MTVKLLTEQNLEFLNLIRGCTGSSESTLVKMPHCWKSHVLAHICSAVMTVITEYLHFQSKPLMNLHNFATIHSLMNDTKFDRQLPISLACAIHFEHGIHWPDVGIWCFD